MAAKLLPQAPDPARVKRALRLAGMECDAAMDARVDAQTAFWREKFELWRAEAEAATAQMLKTAMREQPGSVLRSRDVPDLKARIMAGRAFERQVLAAVLAEVAAPEATANLATDVLAGDAPPIRAGGFPSTGAAAITSVDLLAVVLQDGAAQGSGGTSPSPADLRVMLAPYERERARLADQLLAADLSMAARSAEFALAFQAWQRERKGVAEARGEETDAPFDPALAMALSRAREVVVLNQGLAMQRRAATALDGVLSGDAAWAVYAALTASDPTTTAMTKVFAQVAEKLPGLTPERANAVRGLMSEVRGADRDLMRQGLAAACTEAAANARDLAPLAGDAPVTPELIEQVQAVLAARSHDPDAAPEAGPEAARGRMIARRALLTEFTARMSQLTAQP